VIRLKKQRSNTLRCFFFGEDMSHWYCFTGLVILGIVRDKVLRVVFLSGLLLLLLAPFFSMFSMRQIQELLVTVSLSWVSLTLLLVALILGSSSVWRDIERRWLFSTFGLPIERSTYLFSKITAIFISLAIAGLFLGVIGAGLITIVGSQYSTALDFSWFKYSYAVIFITLKYMLLAAISVFFSSVSTSFFLPIFGSLGVFLAGSASQGVLDYLTSPTSEPLAASTLIFAKFLYYLLPNFSIFDFTTQAVYGLQITSSQLSLGVVYFLIYTAIIICVSVMTLTHRELK